MSAKCLYKLAFNWPPGLLQDMVNRLGNEADL